MCSYKWIKNTHNMKGENWRKLLFIVKTFHGLEWCILFINLLEFSTYLQNIGVKEEKVVNDFRNAIKIEVYFVGERHQFKIN